MESWQVASNMRDGVERGVSVSDLHFPPMPTRDRRHDCVQHALEKDGWTITNDRLRLSYGPIDHQIQWIVFDPATEEVVQWKT